MPAPLRKARPIADGCKCSKSEGGAQGGRGKKLKKSFWGGERPVECGKCADGRAMWQGRPRPCCLRQCKANGPPARPPKSQCLMSHPVSMSRCLNVSASLRSLVSGLPLTLASRGRAGARPSRSLASRGRAGARPSRFVRAQLRPSPAPAASQAVSCRHFRHTCHRHLHRIGGLPRCKDAALYHVHYGRRHILAWRGALAVEHVDQFGERLCEHLVAVHV